MDQIMAESGQRIRVFCVDDHRVMLEGLALLIGRQADMEVVGSATNGEQAIDLVARMKPDVTLMDLQLPGVSGLDAIRKIRQSDPHARIVVLTMYQGDEDIYRALEAGAATYLLKDALSEDLVRVIREVHSGGILREAVCLRGTFRGPGSTSDLEGSMATQLLPPARSRSPGSIAGRHRSDRPPTEIAA